MYSTYLPKNTHPFVYLSLELNSREIDVNVHPTKHEVHFLHEDQIIAIISTDLESKLLGSNNSRVFYVQSKLPVLLHEEVNVTKTVDENKKENSKSTVYDKDLVRTDSNEQKLEKFFGATSRKSNANDSLTEEEFAKQNEKFLENNAAYEDHLNVTFEKNDNDLKPISKNLISKVKQSQTDLRSVLELRKDIEDNCHMSLRQLFSQHVFVGCINPTYALIQYSTKLYICNTLKIMQELFYQFVMYNFENHDFIALTNPLNLRSLARIALDLPETGWTPDDGDKEELAEKIVEILLEKRDMLSEYFSLEIDADAKLKSLPLLIGTFLDE